MSEFSVVIKPNHTEKNYWKDIWHYRELFYILSWRDIKVRYKQTVLGIAWSVLRPLLTIIIFTLIFEKVAGLQSEGEAPYAVMVCAGMLPWQFFANALSEASNSLVANSNLISKVYFPRVIVPASAVATSFIDFAISFVILLGMLAYYQYVPSWHILFIPFFSLLAFLIAFGIGVYLTAINVKYRDFRYIIPFIVQFGGYVSPVGFSSTEVTKKIATHISPDAVFLFYCNPIVGIIDGFRWCIIGDAQELNLISLAFSFAVGVLVLWVGIRYFRKVEKTFADII
jgi:lipopolysaccharide transport system permease protein